MIELKFVAREKEISLTRQINKGILLFLNRRKWQLDNFIFLTIYREIDEHFRSLHSFCEKELLVPLEKKSRKKSILHPEILLFVWAPLENHVKIKQRYSSEITLYSSNCPGAKKTVVVETSADLKVNISCSYINSKVKTSQWNYIKKISAHREGRS